MRVLFTLSDLSVDWMLIGQELFRFRTSPKYFYYPKSPFLFIGVFGFKPAFNWQLDGPSGGDPGLSFLIPLFVFKSISFIASSHSFLLGDFFFPIFRQQYAHCQSYQYSCSWGDPICLYHSKYSNRRCFRYGGSISWKRGGSKSRSARWSCCST